MPKGPKMAKKQNKTKTRKSFKFLKIEKKKHWKVCFGKKYIGYGFHPSAKKNRGVMSENAKLQYANEIKVRFLKKWSTVQNCHFLSS